MMKLQIDCLLIVIIILKHHVGGHRLDNNNKNKGELNKVLFHLRELKDLTQFNDHKFDFRSHKSKYVFRSIIKLVDQYNDDKLLTNI
jgi:hypothetical protein